MSRNRHKIVIIGAGIAGISAAKALYDKGETDFIILEARNRTGGRILSIPFGGETIELGANWIHGVLGNPLFDFSCKNNLVDINSIKKLPKVTALTQCGQNIPVDLVEKVFNAFFTLFKKCEEVFHSECVDQTCVSVGEQLERDINSWLEEQQKLNVNSVIIDHYRLIFNNLLRREASISGCHSMHDLSLQAIGSYEELPGGNVLISDGFQKLVTCMEQSFPREKLLLKHSVTKIYWNDNCTIRIECENKETFEANHVIVTLPLGCLKKTKIFEPPLPSFRTDAIDRLGFGTVNKIFLEYEKPFLNPNISDIMLLWDDADMENIEKNWYRKLFSFTKISETVLIAWITGKEAEYMETISDNEIANCCTEILTKFLLDPYVPKPVRVVRTTWRSQFYTQGSYSYIPVGSSQDDIFTLSKPLYDPLDCNLPRILFAGEATDPKFYSTAHGAYLSGIRAATTIIDECQ